MQHKFTYEIYKSIDLTKYISAISVFKKYKPILLVYLTLFISGCCSQKISNSSIDENIGFSITKIELSSDGDLTASCNVFLKKKQSYPIGLSGNFISCSFRNVEIYEDHYASGLPGVFNCSDSSFFSGSPYFIILTDRKEESRRFFCGYDGKIPFKFKFIFSKEKNENDFIISSIRSKKMENVKIDSSLYLFVLHEKEGVWREMNHRVDFSGIVQCICSPPKLEATEGSNGIGDKKVPGAIEGAIEQTTKGK